MSDASHRRVMNVIARGRLVETDDTHGIQQANLRLMFREAKANVERFQQYGFSSVPPPDSECVVLFPGGSRDHAIIISADSRASRMRGGASGEVWLYTDEGDYVVLKRGNEIEVATKTLTIKADSAINIVGADGADANVSIAGNVNVTKTITADTVNAPHGHVGGGTRYELQVQPSADAPVNLRAFTDDINMAQQLADHFSIVQGSLTTIVDHGA